DRRPARPRRRRDRPRAAGGPLRHRAALRRNGALLRITAPRAPDRGRPHAAAGGRSPGARPDHAAGPAPGAVPARRPRPAPARHRLPARGGPGGHPRTGGRPRRHPARPGRRVLRPGAADAARGHPRAHPAPSRRGGRRPPSPGRARRARAHRRDGRGGARRRSGRGDPPMTAVEAATGFGLPELSPVLLVSSLILIVCVAAVRLATTSGLPTLLLYLAIGLAVGNQGLGIDFTSEQMAQVLGYSALVLILVEGGLTTRWESIRPSVGPALSLATGGVLVSVGAVAVALHHVLWTDWRVSLLIGAILASTDAAAVFSVLRVVPLPRRISGVLEAESGFNDAPVVLLVTALSMQIAHPTEAEPWWVLGLHAGVELAGGAVIGLAVGWLGGRLMRLLAQGTSGLFSIGIVSLGVLAFAT